MTSGMVLNTKSYKVLEQDLKNGKDLDNICSKKVDDDVDYNYGILQEPFLQSRLNFLLTF